MRRRKEQDIRHRDWVLRHTLQREAQTVRYYYSWVKGITFDLDFEYHGAVTHRRERELHFGPEDKAFFKVECVNPEGIHCDLDLGQEVLAMVHRREPEKRGEKLCQGWQDYERMGAHRCLCRMRYVIRIEYEDAITRSQKA